MINYNQLHNVSDSDALSYAVTILNTVIVRNVSNESVVLELEEISELIDDVQKEL